MNTPVLNNCDELLDFLVNNYNTPYGGIAEFQGHKIEFTDLPLDYFNYVIVSPKYNRTVFFINSMDNDDSIDLIILRNSAESDAFPSVVLPKYILKELVATIKGEW